MAAAERELQLFVSRKPNPRIGDLFGKPSAEEEREREREMKMMAAPILLLPITAFPQFPGKRDCMRQQPALSRLGMEMNVI